MNTLPTIEKLPSEGPVTVAFAGAPGGTLSVVANTAGASVNVASSLHAIVTSAGPTNSGHVDFELVDGNGELGRARVVFLIPVSFS